MKVVGKIFAVLFCIIYFFLLTALMVASFASNLVSGNYYSSVLQSIDLKTVKVAELGELADDLKVDKDASVEDVLVKYFTEDGVKEAVALEVINNQKIREVAGKFIGDYVEFQATGERPTIDKKDIESIFEEPAIAKLIESSPEKIELDVDKVYAQLNDLIDEMVEGSDSDGTTEYGENDINVN